MADIPVPPQGPPQPPGEMPGRPGHATTELDMSKLNLLDGIVEKIAMSAKVISTTFAALDLTKISEAAANIDKATSGWTANLKGASDELYVAFRTITATAESFNKMRESGEATNQLRRIAAEMDREAKRMRDAEVSDLVQVNSLWTDINRNFEEYLGKVAQKQGVGFHALRGAKTVDEGSRSLMEIESLPSKMMKLVPGGGLIELMFMGASKTEDWAAKASMVTQQFDSMKGGAGRFHGALQDQIEKMEEWNTHATQDLIGVANALKSGGITAEQALGKSGMSGSLGRVGSSIADVTLKFDYMMEVAAGTGAKMVASGYRDFGNTLKDSAEFITTYGLAAQNAGQETMQFLGSVMQTAESLKLYHVQLSTVADQSLKLIEINRARGMSAAYAGVVSQAGQQQAFQGIQNMQDGYAAFIGERVVKHLSDAGRANIDKVMGAGASSDPISILMEMKRGFRDMGDTKGSKDALGTMVSEIAKQAMEAAGPQRGKQEFYLEKMGFGVEGGRAILDMAADVKAGKGVSTEQLNALKNATTSEAEKTSSMLIAMNKAAHGIADIANGLLGVILSMLKILVGVAVAGFNSPQRESVGWYRTISKGAKDEMGNAFKSFGKGASTLSEIPGALGRRGVLGDFGSNWGVLGEDSASTAPAPEITAAKRAAVNAAFGGHANVGAQTYAAHATTQQAVDRGVQSTNAGSSHGGAFDHPVTGSAPAPGATTITLSRTGNGYDATIKQTTTTKVKIPTGKTRSKGAGARGHN